MGEYAEMTLDSVDWGEENWFYVDKRRRRTRTESLRDFIDTLNSANENYWFSDGKFVYLRRIGEDRAKNILNWMAANDSKETPFKKTAQYALLLKRFPYEEIPFA